MIINGKDYDFEFLTIREILDNLKVDSEKVVVEVNLNIVAREDFKKRIINKEDKIEIVAFVGGG